MLLIVLAVWVIPNLVLLAMHWVPRAVSPGPGPSAYAGIDNFAVVDSDLWRGAAPSPEGYARLAADGIETVVDLRTEIEPDEVAEELAAYGLELVHLPVQDGRVPTGIQLSRLRHEIDQASGPIFVNCGAGVGRTGVAVASHLVSAGASPSQALSHDFGFGPLSPAQVLAVARMRDDGTTPGAGPLGTAMSVIIDAPRRIWARIGF